MSCNHSSSGRILPFFFVPSQVYQRSLEYIGIPNRTDIFQTRMDETVVRDKEVDLDGSRSDF